jgi:phosphomannomutase
MKQEDAYFGGEVSGHYYFKNFFLCDSGLVSFVYILEYLSTSPKTSKILYIQILLCIF